MDTTEYASAVAQTSMRIGWTDEALFFGVRADEPQVEAVVTAAKKKDMESLWSDNSIEFFVFPPGTPAFRQFIVNTVGARWNQVALTND